MRRIFKFVGRSALVFLVLLALLVGWAYTFEDEIKARALAELQTGLTTDMKVGSIEYSVLRSFPYASLECRQIVLMGGFGQNDTLVRAEVLSFDIGLIALIKGDITFRSITLSDGDLDLRRDAQGQGNYLIWKTDTAASTTESAFDVDRLVLEGVSVTYDDRMSDVRVSVKRAEAEFSGALDGDLVSFAGDIATPSLFVETGGTVWVDKAPLSGKLESVLDTESGKYSFENVDFDLAGLQVGGNLTVTSSQKTHISAGIAVNSTDLDAARVLIPAPYRGVIDGYELDGSASAQLDLAGFSDELLWDLHATVNDASLEHLETGAKLDRVNGVYAISGGGERQGAISIESTEARLGSGRIALRGSINSFNEPTMQLTLEGELRLNELMELAGVTDRIQADGRLAVEIGFAGRWPVVKNDSTSTIDPNLLRQSRYNGIAELTGVSFITPDMPRAVEQLNGRLNFEGDYASVKELSLRIGDSDLQVSGTLSNVLPWVLTNDQVLVVNARSQSKRIDLNSLLAADDSSNDDSYAFVLPNDLDLRLETKVDELVFRNFTATGISGSLELNQSGLRVNPMRFKSCNGNANLELAVTPAKGGFRVAAAGVMSAIDIRKLFFAFEEFGQEVVTSANLRGTCAVDAVFTASMSEKLQLDPKSIISSIDLTIENGELIALQSLADIAAYMRENKLISPFIEVDRLEEKMRHIRFATLENRIEIRDERIYLPMMDVKSSAIDIKASGSHWFDDRIDYSVGLYLRDILVRKDRTEFGDIEDDGLGSRFFLSMKGTVDDPQFGYDREAKKEIRKEERRQERETLKQILKDDLNPFKKRDSSDEETNPSGGGGSTITIDWGDGSTSSQPTSTSTQKPKNEPADTTKRRWRISGSDKEEKVAPPADDDDDF
jgi:hypothetical protein